MKGQFCIEESNKFFGFGSEIDQFKEDEKFKDRKFGV